jgi:hypothetical protein
MTGAAKKVTARMLTDLWLASDDSLDRFRKTRRPGDDTWELDHLEQARDLLDLLGFALKTNDDETWAKIAAAWQRLQEPIEPPPAAGDEAASSDDDAASETAKPAVPDPAPEVPPSAPSTPGLDASMAQVRPVPSAIHHRRGDGGVPRPLRPLPELDESEQTLMPISADPGPALPFSESRGAAQPPDTAPAGPRESKEKARDWEESGTAVGFSVGDLSPALPFQPKAADRAISDPGPQDASEVHYDHSFDPSSVAGLQAAPSDPALLSQVIGDADETLQLAAPSEQEPPASPPPSEAQPSSSSVAEPGRDGPTTELNLLATTPGHIRPSLAHLHNVSLEQYACLVAECEAFPEQAEAAQNKVGVQDEHQRLVLDEIFSARFSQDPTARSQWEQLRVSYRAWLESGPPK